MPPSTIRWLMSSSSSASESLLPFMEPIHILGSGSIGLFWASSIRRAFPSYPLAVLFRDHHRTSPVFLKATTVTPNTTEKTMFEKEIVVCIQRQNINKKEIQNTEPVEERISPSRPTQRISQNSRISSGTVSFRVTGGRRNDMDNTNVGSSTTGLSSHTPPSHILHSRSQSGNSQPTMARVPFQFIDVKNQDDSGSNQKHNRRHLSPPIRNLLVCTKAYQAIDAIRSVESRLNLHEDDGGASSSGSSTTASGGCRIIILSNGALDIRDKLEQYYVQNNQQQGQERRRSMPEIILCATTHGVMKEPSSTYKNDNDDERHHDDDDDMFHLLDVGSGDGTSQTFIGRSSTDHDSSTGAQKQHNVMSSIARLWDQSGITTHAISAAEMEILLWKKLAANCICNPLTALWNVTNGELSASHPETFQSIRNQIVSEISQVGNATLQRQGFWELYPHLQHQQSTLLSPHAIDKFVTNVIEANCHNTSSMHRDIHHRPQRQQQHPRQTEIDNLNGYVVRKGYEFGLETPCNNELVERILELTIPTT